MILNIHVALHMILRQAYELHGIQDKEAFILCFMLRAVSRIVKDLEGSRRDLIDIILAFGAFFVFWVGVEPSALLAYCTSPG
jgi:hypothetical protein